ncbi:MAG: hypothetical protein ACM3TR_07290 [Caulobacteraceae bacterium]
MEQIRKTIITVKDTRSVEEKVASLRDLGVEISVKDKNDKYENGYIMGKMKDRCPDLEII